MRVNETVEEVSLGTDRMQQMLIAMQNISATSSEIGKIIKSIEDICFPDQYSCSKCGSGRLPVPELPEKGFAVVADEVRRLAAIYSGGIPEHGRANLQSIEGC